MFIDMRPKEIRKLRQERHVMAGCGSALVLNCVVGAGGFHAAPDGAWPVVWGRPWL